MSTTPTGRLPGRPKKREGEYRQMTLRMPAKTYEGLRAFAAMRQQSLNDLVWQGLVTWWKEKKEGFSTKRRQTWKNLIAAQTKAEKIRSTKRATRIDT